MNRIVFNINELYSSLNSKIIQNGEFHVVKYTEALGLFALLSDLSIEGKAYFDASSKLPSIIFHSSLPVQWYLERKWLLYKYLAKHSRISLFESEKRRKRLKKLEKELTEVGADLFAQLYYPEVKRPLWLGFVVFEVKEPVPIFRTLCFIYLTSAAVKKKKPVTLEDYIYLRERGVDTEEPKIELLLTKINAYGLEYACYVLARLFSFFPNLHKKYIAALSIKELTEKEKEILSIFRNFK